MGGVLRGGVWESQDDWEHGERGEFERQATQFRGVVAEEDVSPGRYHLYVSLACPWAHRTLIARALLGMQDAIGVSVVSPLMFERGWVFDPSFDGEATPDHRLNSEALYQVYQAAKPDYTGRVTVPVLWDNEAKTIVNNESREIITMFATVFKSLWTRALDLYPEPLRERIDAVMDAIYAPINNGVYRCGFAQSQEAYDEAYEALFKALDRWDAHLGEHRYLCGASLTLADLCLFTTLVRFDPVYAVHFKCNGRLIAQYERLSGYLKELYQLPLVRETVSFEHIKQHYYRSHPQVNPTRIVPKGPALAWLDAPHGRELL